MTTRHACRRLAPLAAALALLSATSAAIAQPLPPCAVTGAASVIINGRPALRLSDVATCPPGMFEPVPGISIEGQPAVRFAAPAEGCVAGGSANVIMNGAPATRGGDAVCPPG
ncbi:PAAR domain-containing protein [Stappia sp.]|uniref:PAAR domain-containing protein n=1 Tax=Stappia sp. TaxID=1870903 RepID=UPI003A9A62D5